MKTNEILLQSARELTAATWGQELAIALKQTNILIQDPEEELGSKADRQNVLSFGLKIKNALRDIWTDHATDVFDIGFASRFICPCSPS
jgi:cohesin loading factor subunit SCC2